MGRTNLYAVVLMAALAVTSGARLPLQVAAPAPGPASSYTGADILFLVEAQQATFQDAQTLVLSGLTSTAQSFATGGRTAVYPLQAFTDSSPTSQFVASNGQWLNNPEAVMYGIPSTGGNGTQALLNLSNPKYSQQAASSTIINNNNNNNNNNGGVTNNNNNGGPTLTFTVSLAKADPAAVKVPGGAVSSAASQAAAGAGTPLLAAITPGSQLTNVVLFIDQSQQSLNKVASTKWGWGGWWPYYGYNNYYDNGGYYNNGWNNGYSVNNNNNNNNNGGWGANNNNNNNNNNGYGYANNNNNNNNNGGWGANNNNNNNNNGRH